jgi:hypothetical protein
LKLFHIYFRHHRIALALAIAKRFAKGGRYFDFNKKVAALTGGAFSAGLSAGSDHAILLIFIEYLPQNTCSEALALRFHPRDRSFKAMGVPRSEAVVSTTAP